MTRRYNIGRFKFLIALSYCEATHGHYMVDLYRALVTSLPPEKIFYDKKADLTPGHIAKDVISPYEAHSSLLLVAFLCSKSSSKNWQGQFEIHEGIKRIEMEKSECFCLIKTDNIKLDGRLIKAHQIPFKASQRAMAEEIINYLNSQTGETYPPPCPLPRSVERYIPSAKGLFTK